MLAVEKDWVLLEDKTRKRIVEYAVMDFFGPFLKLELKQHQDGGIIKVTPIATKRETPEYSENHFSLLVKATKELYQRLGKFELQTKFFVLIIDSEDTEKLIMKKLKNMPLF